MDLKVLIKWLKQHNADPFWNKFESKFKNKPSELLKESQSKKVEHLLF